VGGVVLSPAQIIERLEAIDQDLQTRQNEFEEAAEAWTRKKREKELSWARAYMSASGKEVTTRKAAAKLESENVGLEEEAKYEGLKAVMDVLQTRSMIGMGLLKAHGRS